MAPPEPVNSNNHVAVDVAVSNGVSTSTTDGVVGRSDEIDALSGLLQQTKQGRGQVAVMSGEAGIGKTFLLSHFLELARESDFQVVRATCSSMPGATPLWPWQAVLLQHPKLESALTSVRQLQAAMSEGVEPDALVTRRFEIFSKIINSLEEFAESTPLVVAIDDLHWADTGSQDLFILAATQLESSSVFLVGCTRTSDADSGPTKRSILPQLARLPNFTRVNPTVLTVQEVRLVVQAAVGHTVSHDVALQIHAQSKGIPLFVRELARNVHHQGQSLTGTVPDTISQILRASIANLDPDTQEILGLATCLGTAFKPVDVQEISSRLGGDRPISVESVLSAIDSAAQANVIVSSQQALGSFEFTHPLFAEVIRGRIPTATRTRIHAAIAEHLEKRYGNDDAADAGELAWHCGQAVALIGDEKMLHFSLLAGQSALRSFAWSEALAHFEKVKQMTESDRSRIEHAHAWLGIARARMTLESKWGSDLTSADIFEGLSIAFDIFLSHGETELAIEVASQGIVGTPGWRTDPSLAERAIDFAVDDSIATARLLTRYGDVLSNDKSRRQDSDDAFERGFAMAEAHGDVATQLRNLRIRAQARLRHGEFDAVLSLRDRGLKFRGPVANNLDCALLLITGTMAESSLAMFPEADRSLEQARVALENTGMEASVYFLAITKIRNMQGRFDEAVEAGREIERLDGVPATGIFAFIREMYTGDYASCLELARTTLREIPTVPATAAHRSFYVLMMAWIGSELGDQDALDGTQFEVDRMQADLDKDVMAEHLIRRVYMVLAAAQDDPQRARREYENLLPQRATFDQYGGPPRDLLLGRLAVVMGDPELATMHFAKAIEISRKANSPTSECDTTKAYAGFLLDRGSRVEVAEAIRLLRPAIEIAEQHKLRYLGESMNEMLATATQGRVQYPAGLTAREVEICRLLVAGRSNPQIAEELFISMNTVIRHVSNAFRKLGVSSRTEAAVKAVELGVVQAN